MNAKKTLHDLEVDQTDREPTRSYRMRMRVRNLGILYLAGCLIMAVGCVIATRGDPNGSVGQVLVVLAIGGSWGLLKIAMFYRYRLDTDASNVRRIGVFGERTLRLDSVQQMIWIQAPEDGRIRLEGASGRVTVYLSDFLPDVRKELIEYFRRVIAEDKQFGWSKFDDRFNESMPMQAQRET